MDLYNPKLLACGAGAIAGAVSASGVKPEEIPAQVTTTAVALTGGVIGGITLAMAYYAPKHPYIVGGLLGVSGLLGVLGGQINPGNVGGIMLGGAVAFGKPELRDLAALGIYALGSMTLGGAAVGMRKTMQRDAIVRALGTTDVTPAAPLGAPNT